MKNFKIMLSVILSLIMISMSIMPSFAVVAPEDSFSGVLQWQDKIDEVLVEKMSTASDEELIPVWVWLTDIDVDALENEIETKTGISQQKLTFARSEIEYDVSAVSLDKSSTLNKTNSDKNVFSYLEGTKAQREKLANDTEIYLSTKKTLARQKYMAANTTKLRKLGISNDKIEFKSELTPTFIAHLTKDEIIEAAKSSDIVEIGYFSEYDEDNELELDEEPQREQTSTVSDVYIPYTGPIAHDTLKQSLQYDVAFEKYSLTGEGINILHIDADFARPNIANAVLIPNMDNIRNVFNEQDYPAESQNVLPPYATDHTNLCLSYLQTIAPNSKIYCVPKHSYTSKYGINAYDDIEYSINNLNINLINASCSEYAYAYAVSFSARWFDTIISMYNIPVVASAGNTIDAYPYPIAPASGYNSIAVGVYDCRNNRMRYNYTYNPLLESKRRVWYKPDLIVAMDAIPGQVEGIATFGATSAGAPVVSGIVAMMMQLDSSLIGQPEAVKAILMASCQEKAMPSTEDEAIGYDEDMDDGLTLKQGAGKVNALRALNIVAFGTFGYDLFRSERNYSTAATIHLNSQVNTSETANYPLNASVVWFRHNNKTSNYPSNNSVNLGDIYEFDLKAYYSGQTDEIKTSDVNNASKQLVFLRTPALNKNYTIRLYRDSENSVGTGDIMYGYAYSVGNFEKALERVELSGYTAVGKTLSANAYTADGLSANPLALSYKWYSSVDGENWQSISGATSSTYALTVSDLGKYFKCSVEQDYLEWLELVGTTSTKVVLFGDVDGDGEVTVIDAAKIGLYLNGSTTLTEEQLISADVNADRQVTSEDADLIQQFIVGNINKFPIQY